MNRSDLVKMVIEIRDVLENDATDAQVEKFVLEYLENGWLDLGFPDLQKHQTLMNIAMIIVDKIRPIVCEKWDTSAMEKELRSRGLGNLVNKAIDNIVFSMAVSFQEGSNASMDEREGRGKHVGDSLHDILPDSKETPD